jgi:hypothetical protein
MTTCYLIPLAVNDRELWGFLKEKIYELQYRNQYNILVYGEIYCNVRRWLYVTDSTILLHGIRVYWVTIRKIADDTHHHQAMVMIKHRPTIQKGVLHRGTLAVRVTSLPCVHYFNDMEQTVILENIFTQITAAGVRGESARDSLDMLVQKCNLLVSLDFIEQHVGWVKIMLKNMHFIDDNCECKSFDNVDICTCYNVMLKFLPQYIEDVLQKEDI